MNVLLIHLHTQGLKKVYVSNDGDIEYKYAQVYQNPNSNPFELIINQYIIFYDLDEPIEFDDNGKPIKFKVMDKLRWDGNKHVDLVIPHRKVVSALNEEQECALDMLNNDAIPIKFITGVAGSGKTKLAAKIGIHKILDTGSHHKIIALRNPIGAGEDIGFLPGDFEEKTDQFFAPIIDCLKGGELEGKLLEQRGQLEKQIPYFVKGLTYNDSYALVDEAEDLSHKVISLLGTRIGNKTSMVFAGDYKQTENKYLRNNGLLKAIDVLKGNKLVGVVSLSEGVRSDASRLFIELM